MKNLIKLLEPDRFEDLMALQRPVPPGAAVDGPAHRVRRAQARPQEGHLPAPRPRARAQGHVRDHRLPGTGDADRGGDRRASRWARPTPCARSWARRSARRSPPSARSSWRAPSRGVTTPVGRGDVRVHRAVRRLRVQRVTRVRLRLRRLPDRLPDGPPPGRVHGRDPHVGQGRQGSQALSTCTRAADGDRGAPSRRERVRHGLRARARRPPGDPIRAVGRPQRRRRRRARDPRGARERRAVRRRSPTSAGVSSPPRSRSA